MKNKTEKTALICQKCNSKTDTIRRIEAYRSCEEYYKLTNYNKEEIKIKNSLFENFSSFLSTIHTTEEEYNKAIIQPYHTYYKKQKNKYRIIEAPNDKLNKLLRELLKFIKLNSQIPDYAYSLSAGKGIIKNAQSHIGNKEYLNFDILHFYQNCKAKYVSEYFQQELGLNKEISEILTSLTTHDGHLATGAPTSPILSFLIHKELFNLIYKKAKSKEVNMSLYIDDMSFSSKKHIDTKLYFYCKKVLKRHQLRIHPEKIRRFGYKGAWVTGVRISQNGKLSASHSDHYEVVKLLRQKSIEEMSLEETRVLYGKIVYLQQFNSHNFKVTKDKLSKHLKALVKLKTN